MKKIKISLFVLLIGWQLTVGAGQENIKASPVHGNLSAKLSEVNSNLPGKRIEDIGAKWARTCALCHATGVGGAPRVGIVEEWQHRLEQGKAALLAHTIEGFNDMPPLGYCMSCDLDDFSALIDFMTGELR